MTHTGVGEGQLIRQKGLDPYRRVLFINEDTYTEGSDPFYQFYHTKVLS